MLIKKEKANPIMTAKERANSTVLIVEPDPNQRNNLRNAIKTLAFGAMTDAPNHLTAFDKLQERPITHVIFDAKQTNMPMQDFVKRMLEYDSNLVLIPASFEPNVDDVFELLVLGAKGYLVKPFTVDTVDNAINSATKGEPIADVVKQARDRNEALVAILMSALDKAATIIRQSQQFETAKREIPKALAGFKRAADLAQTFAKDGEEGLMTAIEKFCLERSKGPATRLGRLRKRLRSSRV